jgi:hypothetical protein
MTADSAREADEPQRRWLGGALTAVIVAAGRPVAHLKVVS